MRQMTFGGSGRESNVISGSVESVIYANEENGYTILRLRTEEGNLITLVGTLPYAAPGEELTAEGSWSTRGAYGEQFKAEFAELNEAYRAAATNANFYAGAIMPLSANINNIGYAVTAMVGGILTVFGRMDVGALVTYMNYSRQVAMPVNQVSQQINSIVMGIAGASRVYELMDEKPEVLRISPHVLSLSPIQMATGIFQLFDIVQFFREAFQKFRQVLFAKLRISARIFLGKALDDKDRMRSRLQPSIAA